MRVTVLVPTYRRPAYLAGCLRALERQSRRADHVLVVARDSDKQTRDFLDGNVFELPLEIVTVRTPGQVAALNAGLDRAEGDVVAITDDDAAPHADWLERIERHFESDPNLAGVGGRDYLRDGYVYSESSVVGKIQWFGRHVGNHHRGSGAPRDVDVLKGANMSYRMSAVGSLRFDTRLLGAGAQICNDMSFSLRLRRRGWRLRYDPAVAVEHFSAARLDDERFARSRAAIREEAHNETVAVLEYLPSGRWPVFLSWAVLVGHRSLPGVAQCMRLAAMGRFSTWAALKPVIAGRFLGVGTLLRGSAPE